MAELDYVLITGASGFLGTWLADAAHRQGFALLGVDIVQPHRPGIFVAFTTHPCDCADFVSLVGERKLNAVFHLAGSASVPQSVENPVGDFVSLLPGTLALLVYLARHQRDTHLVFFSSAAIYGNPLRLPISEPGIVTPISPYGIHKAAAEFLIEQYARVFTFRASMLRLFSAYGEGLRKQVVWDTCHKAMAAKEEGEGSISMHGTGNETRDFIHASDIARAALLVAANPPVSGTQKINVASGREISIRSLAENVVRQLKCNLELVFDGVTRAGDPVNWRADISRLKALGFASTIPLDEGVRRSLRWQEELQTQRQLT